MRPPRAGWLFLVMAPLVLTCLVTLAYIGRPGSPPFSALHRGQNAAWIVWAMLSVGVVATVRRFPFGAHSAMRWLLLHLVVGTGFSLVAFVLIGLIQRGRAHAGLVAQPPVIASVATGLLVYALVAVSYQALAYHGIVQAREADAARLRADLAEARLAGIESKLQPHFLFNALNSIAALVRKDPVAAEAMLEQLGELLRASLQANPMQEVAFDDALQLAEQYLAIERVRYRDRLRTRIEISPEARRCRVPQLLLQPLVENAVRHGIAPVEGGGCVSLSADVRDGRLRVKVEDDGAGYGSPKTSASPNGLGLRAVRSALDHMCGASYMFNVVARQPRGTSVSIELPARVSA